MKKKLIAGMALVLLKSSVPAAEAEVLRDIVYGHKDGMALVMDVFQPNGNANGAGVVLVMSGGFNSSLDAQRTFIEPYMEQYLDAGFTLFAVRHRSNPRYQIPDAYRDVTQAMEFIGVHAQEYGVDPRRFGVWGINAGGYLSLLVGLAETTLDGQARRFRPAAVVAYMAPAGNAIRPPTPDNIAEAPYLDYERSPELDAQLITLTHVSPDDPPVRLVHGNADETVPVTESERMHAALKEAGAVTALVVIEDGRHVAFEGEGEKNADAAWLDWFHKYVR